MTTSNRLARFAPALFVAFWSTGFIVARYGTHDAGPLSFLTVRMGIASIILWIIASALRAPRLQHGDVGTSAIVGLGMHAMYLGGVFVAIAHGLPSSVSALIAGLHPVITTLVARVVLDEKVSSRQWTGIACGTTGVIAVVWDHRGASGNVTPLTIGAMAVAVIGMVAGTLYQRARGRATPLLRGTAVQYASAGVVFLVGAVANEHWRFESTSRLWFSQAWAVGVLSLAAVLIMLMLLARHAASRVSSLFFMTPALSTVEAAVLFDEKLSAVALSGLMIAVIGVYLATSQPPPISES